MKVLLTGAAGFIGKHLETELRRNSHRVINWDREEGDLREPGLIDQVLDNYRPDVVVHLAARVGRVFGEDDAIGTVMDNAGMTTLVARACGERGIRLAYASTSEVYGDLGEEMAVEGGRMDLPHNLYGLTKRWGEEAAELYAPDGLVVFRLSMPYGPGLPAGRGRAAIINFLDQAARGVPIPVHKGAERSWCWVGDTVRGMRLILESGQSGAWNVGRDDDARPMLEVARLACETVGAPTSLIKEVPAPGMQTVVKRLSTEKLRGLGWQPEVELPRGLLLTYQSLRALQPRVRPGAAPLARKEA